jgi:ubiquitin-conjugating enzyme E2 J1
VIFKKYDVPFRHFTIRGADDTDFAGGVYHGRILLPAEYPYRPPHILFTTPTGRFQCHTKICLSFSAYHPELWQPAWGIRLILEALIAFLPTPADGAIGAVNASSAERQRLAKISQQFKCACCGPIMDLLPPLTVKDDPSTSSSPSKSTSRFQKEIEQLQLLQWQNHAAVTVEQAVDEAKEEKGVLIDVAGSSLSSESKFSEHGMVSDTEQNSIASRKNEAKASKSDDSIPSLSAPATSSIATKTDKQTDTPTAAKTSVSTTLQPLVLQQQQQQQPHDMTLEVQQQHQADGAQNKNCNRWVWLIDPLLQLSIAIMSIICYLLLQKVDSLLDELRKLNDD